MSTKKPLLTISLLISNRPDTIPRCLDSLKLIMDKIPSELILIDTSKSEEIHNLLLTYTDQVYEFEWCKDFAKARNEGVRRANGKWFLYIDDDEWLADVDEIIEFFQSKKYKKEQCANIQVRNFLNLAYTEYTDLWVTRLFYLGDGAKFMGKIHEYIQPIYKEPVFLKAMIYHSGYVFDTEEKKQAHFERNKQLLLEAIKDEPKNLRWAAQLVQEYRTVADWKKIVSLCKKYLTVTEEFTNYMQRNHFCTMYAGLVEGLTLLKRNKDALDICEIGFEDERSTELLKAFLHCYAALNYVELKKWEDAHEQVEKYFEVHEYFQKNKESVNEQLGALIVHRIFEKDYMEKMSNILVYTELRKENIEIPLAKDGEKVSQQMDALSGLKFVKALVKLIASMEYRKSFEYFLKNIEQNQILCEWTCAEVQQFEGSDEESFRRCVYALSKVNSDFWYIWYCRILEADARASKEDVEQALESLLNQMEVVCFMPDRVYEIIDKYDIKVALLWDKVVGEQWPVHVKRLVNGCEDIFIDKAYDYLLDVYDENDWRAQTLAVAFQEKMVLEQQREEMKKLRNQIIEQVKVMYASHKFREALPFVTQLKIMFSEDEEVKELEEMLQNELAE